jgi:dTDP-4-dehydrorhamnose reductase
MKRLLVTGARGQLGQDVCKAATARGLEVSAVDLPELDISRPDAVRACLEATRPEAILNCAAYNAVDRAEIEFHEALLANACGPRNLAVAAERLGVPLMHLSTDYVFDGRATRPYTIADLPNPLGRYGLSKLRGELEVQALARRHYVVRLSWVFGAGNDNFARKVLGWARGRASIQVVDDQVACPAYTADLAPALLELLGSGAFGLYHLANQGHCSRHAWARHLVSAAGLGVEVLPASSKAFPTAAARPAFSALDCFPLEGILGRMLPPWQDATERFLLEIGART